MTTELFSNAPHSPTKIGYHIGNLCDILFYTPLVKDGNPRNITIDIVDDEVAKNKAPLFNGLCPVTISKSPSPPPLVINRDTHRSQSYLDLFELSSADRNFLPKIIVTNEELEWARNFLKDFNNPIIYIPNNSCSYDKRNLFSQMRTFTKEMNDVIIRELSRKYTLLQFGLNNKFYSGMRAEIYNYDNVINIENLNIRQLAACYSVIGKGFCSDTGDPYLMLAVGGKIIEIVPMYSIEIYPYYQYIYCDTDLWKNEKIRAKYFCMKDWKDALEFTDFNF